MRFIMIIIAAFLLAGPPDAAVAQVRVGISFNLGIQPAWGPVGYDYVENYYMPDIDVYYNVPHRLYYFMYGGRWIGRSSLPSRYGSFDRYSAHKVVINDRDPWRRHDKYRNEYGSYKTKRDQTPIRDSKDNKYFANKYHPQHNNWLREQRPQKQNPVFRGNGNRNNNGNNGNMKSRGNSGNNGKQGNNGNGNGKGGNGNGKGGGKGKR